MAKPNEEMIMWVLVIIAGVAIIAYQLRHQPKPQPPPTIRIQLVPTPTPAH